jgi:hypothetical protein
VLLADPGGYYLADAAPSSDDSGPAPPDAPYADTGSSGGDDQGDTGSVAEADANPVDAGPDGPKCHSTQIQQPVNGTSVSAPVHLVTTWDPCMAAIDCYLDPPSNPPVATTTSATGTGIDAYVNMGAGTHSFVCSTFYVGSGGGQSPSTTFHVVAGDAATD